MKLNLKNVRLSFPQLFEAKTVGDDDKAAFSAAFLLSPDHPQLAEVNNAIEEVGKAKWGTKWPVVKKELTGKDRTCLHSGDTKAQYAGYEGNFFITARNAVRPKVLARDRTPLLPEDGKMYSGAYVVGIVELWAQDDKYGKRINATLLGCQFFRDGEAFSGGGVAADDDFEDLGVDEEADDLA